MPELRIASMNEDSAVSSVDQHDGKNATTDGNGDTQEFVGKVAAGEGIGTLLGIAVPFPALSPSSPLPRSHRPQPLLRQ